MSDPFDGAGKPYRGSSYRGWIVVGIVSLVVIALMWMSWSIVDPDDVDQGPIIVVPVDAEMTQ